MFLVIYSLAQRNEFYEVFLCKNYKNKGGSVNIIIELIFSWDCPFSILIIISKYCAIILVPPFFPVLFYYKFDTILNKIIDGIYQTNTLRIMKFIGKVTIPSKCAFDN